MNLFFFYFKSLKTTGKIFLLLFIGYFAGLWVHLFLKSTYYQWDFQVYYSAAKCYLQNLNPYNMDDLFRVHTNVAKLAYLYPPVAIYYFLPFALLNAQVAAAVYLCFKFIALIGLYYIWSKIYYDKKYLIIFLCFSLWAFNTTIQKDLFTGNISIFEQLFIWTAIYFFLKDRLWIFSLLIIVVSTFKLLPIIFLTFVLFSDSRHRIKVFFVSSTIFVLYLALNYVAEPVLSLNYVHAVISNPVKEYGITNACSLEFFGSLARAIYIDTPSYVSISAYIVFVSVISFFTWMKLKGIINFRSREAKLVLVFTLCLGIILVLPRFKDYSYIMAILPVFYLIIKTYKRSGPVLILILVCLSGKYGSIPVYQDILALFWGYFTLIVSFTAWIFYLKEIEIVKLDTVAALKPKQDT